MGMAVCQDVLEKISTNCGLTGRHEEKQTEYTIVK